MRVCTFDGVPFRLVPCRLVFRQGKTEKHKSDQPSFISLRFRESRESARREKSEAMG